MSGTRSAGGRRERVEALFLEALELEPTGRRRLLDEACVGEPGVRAEVESLLEAHDGPGPLGEMPEEERLGGRFPERFGPYRIVRILGEGGMGVVLLAIREAEGFEQTVALKIVRGRFLDPALARRFQEERRILARLEHPGIARLIDGGVMDDGQPFYAMEYVEGQDLLTWCDERRLGVEERVRLFIAICEAVHAAHQQMVVHRDLKPSNIMVSDEGQPKLLDFGIAKRLEDDAGGPTQLWVTPAYASPEQVTGAPVTMATDVYALGVLLCELLSGHRPYRTSHIPTPRLGEVIARTTPRRPSELAERGLPEAEDEAGADPATVAGIAHRRGLPPGRLARTLRGDLDLIVLTALAKEPERRYGSARRLGEDLRRWLEGRPIEARPASLGYRVRKFLGRNRAASVAAALFAAALAAGTVATAWQAHRASVARDAAAAEAERARQVTGLMTEIFRLGDPTQALGDTIGVQQVLAEGARRVEETLADDPELQATLFLELARIYRNLGLLDDAVELADRTVEIRRALPGDEVAHAEALGLRALLARDAGEPDAVPRLEAALERHRAVPAAPDTLEAELLMALGWAVRADQEYERAEALFREAIGIWRAQGEERGPGMARALLGLASAFHDRGSFEEAEALFREALEEGGGRPDPVAATAMANLGMLRRLREQYVEAVPLLRGAREMRAALYAPEHPDRIESDKDWGLLLSALGRFREAEALLRDVLDRSVRVLGEGHVQTRNVREALAGAEGWLGRYPLALARMDSVIEAKRIARGGDHPGVIYSLEAAGTLLLEDGRPDEARAHFEEGLAMGARLGGNDGVYGMLLRAGLGRVALAEGAVARADSLAEEAAALAAETLRDDHRYVLDVRRLQARILLAQGRPAQALAVLDPVAEAEARIRPYPHPRRGETELLRARALRALGEGEAADRALDEAARHLEELPPGHRLWLAVAEERSREG